MHDINVYGPIGKAWDEDAVSAADFAKALKDADGDDVCIHINSVGGDVFDANAMSETLRGYKGRSTASIEGIAASAASYFALTADEVVINPSALVMVHNPFTMAYGRYARQGAFHHLGTVRGKNGNGRLRDRVAYGR